MHITREQFSAWQQARFPHLVLGELQLTTCVCLIEKGVPDYLLGYGMLEPCSKLVFLAALYLAEHLPASEVAQMITARREELQVGMQSRQTRGRGAMRDHDSREAA